MGYKEEIIEILRKYPDIDSIDVRISKTENIRLNVFTAGFRAEYTEEALKTLEEEKPVGYATPSGLKPVIPAQTVTPELIAKLKGGTYEESVTVLNAKS
jgi:hypothetical protein